MNIWLSGGIISTSRILYLQYLTQIQEISTLFAILLNYCNFLTRNKLLVLWTNCFTFSSLLHIISKDINGTQVQYFPFYATLNCKLYWNFWEKSLQNLLFLAAKFTKKHHPGHSSDVIFWHITEHLFCEAADSTFCQSVDHTGQQ